MQRHLKIPLKKRSHKAGLPPGTLMHIGRTRQEGARITVIDYDESNFSEDSFDSIEACFAVRERPAVTWINIEGIHQTEIIEKIGACFDIHPLVLEDIQNTEQRPKIENYSDYLYIVLKMLYFDDKLNAVSTEQVSLIVGRSYVISLQEGLEGDLFGHLRDRLRNEKGRARRLGADYLAYSLIDAIVDNYFVILEKLGEKIELIEERLIMNPTTSTLHDIHYLKREMIYLRKAVWPLREAVNTLSRTDSEIFQESTRIYLRDVYDHTIQVIDTVESHRDIVSGMLDIYLSSVSNRMNSIMKVLTVIATIFMPLTFIAGVYGMNFRYMPELEWRYGYFLVWGVMIGIGVLMLRYFRKKRWL